MRRIFLSALTNIGYKPGPLFKSIHRFKIYGDGARWASFFAEQARFTFQIIVCLETFFGDELDQATTARWQFGLLVGIYPLHFGPKALAKCQPHSSAHPPL